MSGNVELSGPDLEAGVAVSEIPEGKPFAAHAHGEPFVVVRQGARLRLIGGVCTHYSAPLSDGLVVGDTVRCPWHHACFDLDSGRAVGAPALNAVACHEVEVRDGRAFIGAKKTRALPPAPGSAPGSVVVIGAGAAGAAAVETLRAEGYAGSITLVGDEAGGPVDRPNLSKDYLAGTAPKEWVTLRDADFYTGLEIDRIEGDPAAAVDAAARTVTLASGRALHFGALLLATGAAPNVLRAPGGDRPHVRTLRSFTDAEAIIERATSAKRAVVIGASFIGLEAAASLRARGLEVDVVGREAVPLAKQLGPELGALVRSVHEEHGVRFHLGRSPASITEAAVVLDDGTSLPADLVVAGVGVKPRTALAEAAGLRVEDGVVVDAQFRTSAPGVFAAGDVARYPQAGSGDLVRVEHWVAAERQGQAAARAMLGDTGPFRGVPFFWSAHYDLTISYVGVARDFDAIEVRGELAARDATLVYRRKGRAIAVATIGRDPVSLAVEAALERGDDAAVERALD